MSARIYNNAEERKKAESARNRKRYRVDPEYADRRRRTNYKYCAKHRDNPLFKEIRRLDQSIRFYRDAAERWQQKADSCVPMILELQRRLRKARAEWKRLKRS